MNIDVERVDSIKKITLNVKKFDVANMQEIKKNIQAEVEADASDILMDLSKVSFVDSSGLSVIISIFKQLKSSNHQLKLCGLQEQPMELLEITQLHKIFTIIDSCNK